MDSVSEAPHSRGVRASFLPQQVRRTHAPRTRTHACERWLPSVARCSITPHDWQLLFLQPWQVGHYFGLFHIFQNGCNDPGDSIPDTPPQGSSTYGNCYANVGKDTCAGGGSDDISNFMDYRCVRISIVIIKISYFYFFY